jgi:putative ABC transport system permease protein
MFDIFALLDALPGAVAQGLIWSIMAIGVYITYKILDIADLTVDGTLCTGGAVCLVMIINGHSLPVSILTAVLAGGLCGLVTGILHTLMGIPAILSGILTQIALYSVNLKILGKANVGISSLSYHVLVSLRSINRSLLVLAAAAAIVIVFLYWLFGTERGCSLRATGCNENMAKAQGINTNVNKVIGLTISNALVGLSGALLTQYQGFADINMGRGAIVIGLAAVIIGEAVIGRFFKNFGMHLLSVVFGSVLYYIVLQIVIWMEIDTDLLKALQAAVVAVFLAVPYWKRRCFTKPKLQQEETPAEEEAE